MVLSQKGYFSELLQKHLGSLNITIYFTIITFLEFCLKRLSLQSFFVLKRFKWACGVYNPFCLFASKIQSRQAFFLCPIFSFWYSLYETNLKNVNSTPPSWQIFWQLAMSIYFIEIHIIFMFKNHFPLLLRKLI